LPAASPKWLGAAPATLVVQGEQSLFRVGIEGADHRGQGRQEKPTGEKRFSSRDCPRYDKGQVPRFRRVAEIQKNKARQRETWLRGQRLGCRWKDFSAGRRLPGISPKNEPLALVGRPRWRLAPTPLKIPGLLCRGASPVHGVQGPHPNSETTIFFAADLRPRWFPAAINDRSRPICEFQRPARRIRLYCRSAKLSTLAGSLASATRGMETERRASVAVGQGGSRFKSAGAAGPGVVFDRWWHQFVSPTRFESAGPRPACWVAPHRQQKTGMLKSRKCSAKRHDLFARGRSFVRSGVCRSGADLIYSTGGPDRSPGFGFGRHH